MVVFCTFYACVLHPLIKGEGELQICSFLFSITITLNFTSTLYKQLINDNDRLFDLNMIIRKYIAAIVAIRILVIHN